MFDNTIAAKRMLKKNALIGALSKAKADNKEWKVKQIEGKMACFERKNYPKVLWDSSNGTYRKPKEA